MQVHRIDSAWLTRQVNIVLVGAGGTGSQVMSGLAQLDAAMRARGHPAGLSVTVLDPDLVSEANVGRQLFYAADVGLPKASVLVHRVNMTCGTAWQAVVANAQETTGWHSCDLVIGCVDNAKARRHILQVLVKSRRRIYWLDCGNRRDSGQVILGEVGRTSKTTRERLPHVGDLFPEIIDEEADDDDTPSCSLAEALEKQALFINRAMALYALNMLEELFHRGEIGYHGVFIDLRRGRTNTLAIDPVAWKRLGWKPRRTQGSRKAA